MVEKRATWYSLSNWKTEVAKDVEKSEPQCRLVNFEVSPWRHGVEESGIWEELRYVFLDVISKGMSAHED